MGKNLQLQTIIVGNITDYFINYATNLLSSYGIKFILCEDIYKVTAKLAKESYENVLVIGRVEKLGIEKERFFSKMNEKGFRCCCLVENNHSARLKYMRETAATVINKPVELEEKIADLLTNHRIGSSAGKNRNSNALNFDNDKFLTTKAEMDALLGS